MDASFRSCPLPDSHKLLHELENKILTERIQIERHATIQGLEMFQGVSVTRYVERHWHSEFQFCVIRLGSHVRDPPG